MSWFYWLESMVPAKQETHVPVSFAESRIHVNGMALHWHAVLSGVSWDVNPSPHSL